MHKTFHWAACGLFFVLGCAGNSLPPAADADRGRELLKIVLERWIQGGSPDDLKQGNPPIIARDPDWETGYKLTGYEIAPEDSRIGVDLLLRVTLTLSKGDAKPRSKTVNFSVAVGSQIVVVRQT